MIASQASLISSIAYSKHSKQNQIHILNPNKRNNSNAIIIMIHGGGWRNGSLNQYLPHCIHFSEQGYLAATIGYRLFPEVTIELILNDIQQALEYLQNNQTTFNIAYDQIYLMGSSAGGQLSLMTASLNIHNKNMAPIKAVVAQCPVTTLVGFDRWDEIRRNYPLEKCSPIHATLKGLPPIQIQHGNADSTVPIEHSQLYAEQLTKAKVINTLEVIPGCEHGYGYQLHQPFGAHGITLATQWFQNIQ